MKKILFSFVLMVGAMTFLGHLEGFSQDIQEYPRHHESPLTKENPQYFVNNDGEREELSSDISLSCAFVEKHEELREEFPWLPSNNEFERWMQTKIREQNQQHETLSLDGPRCDIMYIPYVVHIMHPSDPVNVVGDTPGINISAAQVESQIGALNRAFRKINFSRNNSPEWDDVASDFRIEFVPVTINPETGETLEEPGIDRIDLNEEGYPVLGPPILEIMDETIKPETIWNPVKVFNIWTVNIAQTTGVLGYAQFPEQSGLQGLPQFEFANRDGVVCDVFTFQYRPDNDESFTGYFDGFDLGATSIHEIGHWVGLRHIWGDGDCTADDFVEDTPVQASATSGCPNGQDTCSVDDLPDMVQNYMDYSGDHCFNLFTKGQKERVDVVFANSPRRASLLTSEYADYKDREPYVFFEVEDLKKDINETTGCANYSDVMLRVRIKDCTDLMGEPVVTVSLNEDTTMEEGVDFEFLGSTTVAFFGYGPETIGIPVRIFNDEVTEGIETLVFDMTLEANGSDAVLYPDENYTKAIWNVDDGLVLEELPAVFFDENPIGVDLPEGSPCLVGDVNLRIDFGPFPGDITWDIKNEADEILASGGPYSQNDTFTSVDLPIDMGDQEGDFTLNVYDSFGDGIADGYGFKLTSSGSDAIIRSGVFDSETNIPFCYAGSSFDASFEGILPYNDSVFEVKDCGQTYNEYFVAITLEQCVKSEQDVTVEILIDDELSTATENVDYIFPSGKEVTFSGTAKETLIVPIRFLGDDIVEGDETLVLELKADREDLTRYIDLSTNEITIVDANSPVFTLNSDTDEIRESEYGCETDTKTFDVTINASTICPANATDSFEVLLKIAENSETTADDVVLQGDNSHTFTTDNFDTPATFTFEINNDNLTEGAEELLLEIEVLDNALASINNVPLSIILHDPLYATDPITAYSFGLIDFESGLPEGWELYVDVPDAPNFFVISENTDLDGNALHITNNPDDEKPYAYSDYEDNPIDQIYYNNLYLLSPPFYPEGEQIFDLDFQVEGESLPQGIFDHGFVWMVDANQNLNDFTELRGTAYGWNLFEEPNPTTLSLYTNEVQDLVEWYNISHYNYSSQVRLMLGWRSDIAVVNNPPIAFDNIDLTKVFESFYIETEKMGGSQRGYTSITANDRRYFYNTEDEDIALSISSSVDQGCGTGYVVDDGVLAKPYISNNADELIAEKTYAIVADAPNKEASIDVDLYYTEEEISGWEDVTGNDRGDLAMYKVFDTGLATCFDNEMNMAIKFDRYPNETSWEIIDLSNNEVVVTRGPYFTSDPYSTVVESFDLPDGNYKFNFNDSHGDGICCANGEGYFRFSSNGETIAEGSTFKFLITENFCTSGEAMPDPCIDYSDIEIVPVTLTPFKNGFKVSGSFTTGLSNTTGFGIGRAPAYTPEKLEAIQVEEQINITFETQFELDDRTVYLIFEELNKDFEWVELETVEVNGESVYEIFDYFPYKGMNKYRVGAVSSSGEVVYSCLEAKVFFESTDDFIVTPNPATNETQIIISDGSIEGQISIEVYNENGQLMGTSQLESKTGVVRHTIDVNTFAAGLYYIKLTAENGQQRSATFIKVEN